MLSFESNYRALLFIMLENEHSTTFNEIGNWLQDTCELNKGQIFYSGVSFGLYDWCVEFQHETSKGASFICNKMLDIVQGKGYNNLGSYMIYKKIINGNSNEKNKMIRSYTFLGSNKVNKLPILERVVNKNTDLDVSFYYNVSQYPLLLQINADSLNEVFNKIKIFRKNDEENFFNDTNTRLVLNYPQYLKTNISDKKDMKLKAYLNIKTKNISQIDNLIIALSEFEFETIAERQGYFDIICTKKFDSLIEIHEIIMELRNKLSDKLKHTSTYVTLEGS